MSHSSSVSSGSRMRCHCGITAWIFTAYSPVNAGRRFYKGCRPEKKNDCIHREKKALETRMNDLERYLAYDIEKKCEREDEISVFKVEEVVSDNEEIVVDNEEAAGDKPLRTFNIYVTC
ncbi:hypothetical protein RND71_035427 [Anisodus tanguticus]|uniref:Uncharacterized protein n=1 Tax=Anisodus tanguticus TaxID=243964 RepID=A0AAE1UZR8_9SOLA|nr:hypothetical protein RND71_035427 [Anisodus tanguticus]